VLVECRDTRAGRNTEPNYCETLSKRRASLRLGFELHHGTKPQWGRGSTWKTNWSKKVHFFSSARQVGTFTIYVSVGTDDEWSQDMQFVRHVNNTTFLHKWGNVLPWPVNYVVLIDSNISFSSLTGVLIILTKTFLKYLMNSVSYEQWTTNSSVVLIHCSKHIRYTAKKYTRQRSHKVSTQGVGRYHSGIRLNMLRKTTETSARIACKLVPIQKLPI
jgi:hypothetical protein